MDWLITMSQNTWQNAGKLPQTVNRWITHINLIQVIWKMDIRQAIFNLNTCGINDKYLGHI